MRFIRQNSFLVTLLTLVLLCLALSEARADVKGIPFSEAFSTAQFPYARVAVACDAWRKPAQFPDDSFGDVSFSGACAEHDRCFHTLGVTWGDCNERYKEDLNAACARDIKRSDLEKGLQKTPDAQALKMCEQIAAQFFARTQAKEAPKLFELAQSEQRAYLQYVRGVVDSTYKSVLRRGATPAEQGKALQSLTREWSLDDLKASLMGARIDQGEPGELGAQVMPAIEIQE